MKKKEFKLTWTYNRKKITTTIARTPKTLYGYTQFWTHVPDGEHGKAVVVFFNEKTKQFWSPDYLTKEGDTIRAFERALKESIFH